MPLNANDQSPHRALALPGRSPPASPAAIGATCAAGKLRAPSSVAINPLPRLPAGREDNVGEVGFPTMTVLLADSVELSVVDSVLPAACSDLEQQVAFGGRCAGAGRAERRRSCA
jgi:hypothetical protein